MKSIKLILLVMIAALFSNVLLAQVSVGINIGVPAPRYYYLQDIGAYFDIQASMYIYLSGSRWIRGRVLPSSYGHYDFDNGHKIIIRDYHGSRPYSYYKQHRKHFPKGHYGQDKNYWSAKEYRGQGSRNNNAGKEYKRENRNNKFRGNEGNNRGNDKGNGQGKRNGGGNGKGHGKGK